MLLGHPGSWLDGRLPLDLQFGPIEDEEREATSNALSFLLKEVTRGAPTMRYTASDLRRSQEDRDNWSLFYQQPPSLPAPVARWRHWKPRQLQDTDPITQRQLEKELRLKWAQRLICLLAPFADKIPNMASVMGKDQEREWIDLLGDTRFRTLRIHCLALETICRHKDSLRSRGQRQMFEIT